MKRVYLVFLFLAMWILGSVLIYDGRISQTAVAVKSTQWNVTGTMIISFGFALAYVFVWVWEAVVMRFTNKAFILKFLVASSLVMAILMWLLATFPWTI